MFGPRNFGLHENEEQGQKWQESDQKENPAAFAVNIGIDHIGTDMDAEFAYRDDTYGISQHPKR